MRGRSLEDWFLLVCPDCGCELIELPNGLLFICSPCQDLVQFPKLIVMEGR